MLPWTHSSPHPKQHRGLFRLFCTAHTKESLHFTMGCHFSTLKLPLHMGKSGPPSSTCFLGHTRVHNPNGILAGSAVFAGLTIITDHFTPSVTIGHVYVSSTAMQPKNKDNFLSVDRCYLWDIFYAAEYNCPGLVSSSQHTCHIHGHALLSCWNMK